ncbi:MAG: hypothetical protein WC982_09295 [Advenella sp.]
MMPTLNSQELDEEYAIQNNETQQEPETEEWAKNNLSWLSQSEYQRYLDFLEEKNVSKDLQKTNDTNL